jgi:hypothetical protein
MSQENNTFESQAVIPTEIQPTKSPAELEARFGLPKVFGSLALAAAALGGGMQNAEAGGASRFELNTPQIVQLQAELDSLGVQNIQGIESYNSTYINTNKGKIKLSPEDGVYGIDLINRALVGVDGQQFLKEIQRQNTTISNIEDRIDTSHGIFSMSITPYAQKVLQGNGIAYRNGKLSNGRHVIDMTGDDNPNTECKITGWGEFKNFVVADCLEVTMATGKPMISSVKYQINPDMSVIEIKK